MAVIETKADELMGLLKEKGRISSKDAAKAIGVEEPYVRKLALILHKRDLIDINATAFMLWLVAKE